MKACQKQPCHWRSVMSCDECKQLMKKMKALDFDQIIKVKDRKLKALTAERDEYKKQCFESDVAAKELQGLLDESIEQKDELKLLLKEEAQVTVRPPTCIMPDATCKICSAARSLPECWEGAYDELIAKLAISDKALSIAVNAYISIPSRPFQPACSPEEGSMFKATKEGFINKAKEPPCTK